MNSLITVTTLLALVALTEGSLVVKIPGLTGPVVNHGITSQSR